eukprot:jgi/Botrbrau1/13769/Bobra.0056s0024.1
MDGSFFHMQRSSSCSGRQGGQSGDCPTLQEMAQAVQKGAYAALGLKCGESVLGRACAGTGGDRSSPLSSALLLLVAALAAALLLAALFSLALRFYRRRRGSVIVAAAAAAAAELRHNLPQLYPPVPHTWYKLAPGSTAEPLLCAVCFQAVNPDASLLTSAVSCCEVCGLLVHESGCVRAAPPSCRPLALEGALLPHHWRPAACRLPDPDDEEVVANAVPEVMSRCIFCRQPCVTDFTATEPVWDCSACRCTCHSSCYFRLHKGRQTRAKSVEKEAIGNEAWGATATSLMPVEMESPVSESPGVHEGMSGTGETAIESPHTSRHRIRVSSPTLVSRKSYSASPKKTPVRLSGNSPPSDNSKKADRRAVGAPRT